MQQDQRIVAEEKIMSDEGEGIEWTLKINSIRKEREIYGKRKTE